MPKVNKTSGHANSSRAIPYPTLNITPVSSEASGFHPPSPPPSGNERQSIVTPWNSESDTLLMRARQQGLNWQPIALTYFPDKTPNACRKRHERLMEKRNGADSWDIAKVETLAKAYQEIREEMWRILADRVGEKWQIVEAKCMEKGLKTLQTAGRSASRRERQMTMSSHHAGDISPDDYLHRDVPSHSSRSRSQSHDNNSDGFNDSAIGPDPDHQTFSTHVEDRPLTLALPAAHFPTTSTAVPMPSLSPPHSYSPRQRTFSGSSLLNNLTPINTSMPSFSLMPSPISGNPAQQQTLPSFSTAFSDFPSVIASSIPRRPPTFVTPLRSPPVATSS